MTNLAETHMWKHPNGLEGLSSAVHSGVSSP